MCSDQTAIPLFLNYITALKFSGRRCGEMEVVNKETMSRCDICRHPENPLEFQFMTFAASL